MGRNSKEAFSGCILANKANKLESSWAIVVLWGEFGLSGKEFVMLNRLFACDRVLVGGVSSTIVASSLRSTPSPETSANIDLCLFSSISNTDLAKMSISFPISPKTVFHSSSHSIAISTDFLTSFKVRRIFSHSDRIVSTCSTTLLSSSTETV